MLNGVLIISIFISFFPTIFLFFTYALMCADIRVLPSHRFRKLQDIVEGVACWHAPRIHDHSKDLLRCAFHPKSGYWVTYMVYLQYVYICIYKDTCEPCPKTCLLISALRGRSKSLIFFFFIFSFSMSKQRNAPNRKWVRSPEITVHGC